MMRDFRLAAKKKWKVNHESSLQTVMETLRQMAIKLFADYIKKQDWGAYLAGDLLRIEMLSNPDAIKVSVFLGDDGPVTLTERDNWERGLHTIRQLSAKWREMFPDETMPPIEVVTCATKSRIER
ncbi:hypothetical protein NliqN6_1359 [Naganishia liquefaciens]|uniref:Uncharacterized protein n=1 Tax=Naganishia liquefaciens TaxID=104408 RepID=A0A8H3YE68_9TREE|nr:hypothetical protein NliqN6_1359 [Naganishia liquefaciens]